MKIFNPFIFLRHYNGTSSDGVKTKDSFKMVNQTISSPNLNILYPQMTGLSDEAVQQRINGIIEKRAYDLLRKYSGSWKDFAGVAIEGNYGITLSKDGLLSINFEFNFFSPRAACSISALDNLTLDIHTEAVYTLDDLFLPASDYKKVLRSQVRQKIKEMNIPLISEYRDVPENPGYYLCPASIVLFYPLNEFTPYYYGIPKFEIPYSTIGSILRPNGPVAMLTS